MPTFTQQRSPIPLAAPADYQVPPGVLTVLCNGLGADSVANWFLLSEHPARYGLKADLSDLVVITAMTGMEWPKTIAYFERHVLPQFRERGVRFVQVARRGPRKRDGIIVLDDSRYPKRIIPTGPYTIDDELRLSGTVPNIAGGQRCSQRFKAEVLESWYEYTFGAPIGPAWQFRRVMGYDDTKHERGRAKTDRAFTEQRNKNPRSPYCTTIYPLQDAGMDRPAVIAFNKKRTKITWPKSYCTVCPYPSNSASRPDHLASCAEEPDATALVLLREYIANILNPRVLLYGKTSLRREITLARDSGILTTAQTDTIDAAFERRLNAVPWRVYRVRRVITAGRDKSGNPDPGKKGTGWRSVSTRHEAECRSQAQSWLETSARTNGWDLESDSASGETIIRAWSRRRNTSYPVAEEFWTAAPAGPDHVPDKERPGFAQIWAETLDHARSHAVRDALQLPLNVIAV
ncbi:hypothetical protein ACFC1B_06845 [Streptomyces xiamenensis]|uniref:hypothetical protein n=1 Tax=Streptomyces xiamenensis TaxID=408015 RepID=UPI0035DF09EE